MKVLISFLLLAAASTRLLAQSSPTPATRGCHPAVVTSNGAPATVQVSQRGAAYSGKLSVTANFACEPNWSVTPSPRGSLELIFDMGPSTSGSAVPRVDTITAQGVEQLISSAGATPTVYASGSCTIRKTGVLFPEFGLHRCKYWVMFTQITDNTVAIAGPSGNVIPTAIVAFRVTDEAGKVVYGAGPVTTGTIVVTAVDNSIGNPISF